MHEPSMDLLHLLQAAAAVDASSSGSAFSGSGEGISSALEELLDRCQHQAEVLTAAGELLGKARVTLEHDGGEAAATGLDQVRTEQPTGHIPHPTSVT
jgi:hypothetical protein